MVTEKINKEIEAAQKKIRDLHREIKEHESDLEQLNDEYEELASGLEFDKAEEKKIQIKTTEAKLETKRDFVKLLDIKDNKNIENAMIESYNDYLAFRKKKQKEGQSHVDKINKNIKEIFKSMDKLEELTDENVTAIKDIHTTLIQLGWNDSSPIRPFNLVANNSRLFNFDGHNGLENMHKTYKKDSKMPELVYTKGRGE